MAQNSVSTIPLAPGIVLTGYDPSTTPEAAVLAFLGKESQFPDETSGSYQSTLGVPGLRTGRMRSYRVVQNRGSTTLQAGQCVTPSGTGGVTDIAVTGVNSTAGAMVYVVDDQCPATGVPQWGVFLVHIAGPALVNNSTGNNVVGDSVVATSTSGEAATVADGSITAAQVNRRIGICMRARNAANKILVNIIGNNP